MRKKTILAVTTMLAVLCAGCGASTSSTDMAMATMESSSAYDGAAGLYSNSYAMDSAAYPEESVSMEDADTGSTGESSTIVEENSTSNRKLITTMYISAQTEDYDTLMQNVNSDVTRLGGYIEYSDESNGNAYYYSSETSRSAYLTIRIPAEKLDEFVGQIEEEANIYSQSKSVEDVTLSYVDLESHKTALKAEESRLMELMEQAETVEDLIAIEDKLADIRYQIESMESQLRTYDNQIDYSTINLSIDEVERITPAAEQTAWSKISTGFGESIYNIGKGIQNFAISFVIHIPYIVVCGVIILVIVLVIRKIRKRHLIKKSKGTVSKEKEEI